MKKLSVFEYLDASSYLRDYYERRKAIDKNFSYQTWADQLDFNSRSFLRMMVVGKKRLTAKVVEAITQQQFETQDERDYFFYLVQYSQAASKKDRNVYSQKMIQIIRTNANPVIIADSQEFTANPILPCLLALFNYDDIVPSIANFANILNMSESETLSALQELEKLKFVQPEPGTDLWKSNVTTFKVPDNKGSQYLREFHEKSLRRAIEAFDLPKEIRHYKSLLLPMSTEDYALFKELLNEFARDQIARHSGSTCSGKRFFQLNFNMYPVTEPIGSEAAVGQ